MTLLDAISERRGPGSLAIEASTVAAASRLTISAKISVPFYPAPLAKAAR